MCDFSRQYNSSKYLYDKMAKINPPRKMKDMEEIQTEQKNDG